MIARQSLLDLVAIQMGCSFISDLQFLSDSQRCCLAHKLDDLIPRKEDVHDWNDALEYLTGAPPEKTAYAAKVKLVELLLKPGAACGEDDKGDANSEKQGAESEF